MKKTLSYVVPVLVSILIASIFVVLFVGSTARAFSATTPFTVGTSSSTFLTVTDTGNVGIGTTTPPRALWIDGNQNFPIGIGIKNYNSGSQSFASIAFLNNIGNVAGFFYNGSNTGFYAGPNSINLINAANAPLGLGTNDQLQMTILGNGNVGIATSTWDSAYKLQVDGRIRSSGSVAAYTLQSRAGGAQHALYDPDGTGLLFDIQGVGTVIKVGTSGNVGVGTASPAAKLDVAGNVKVGGPSAPKGITIYDKTTGSPYCLEMNNGVFTCTAGACQ